MDSRSFLGDLLLTGATGFLGSHVLMEWLGRYPDARACCVVRGRNPTGRIRDALSTCRDDSGTLRRIDALMRRITVVGGDLCEKTLSGNQDLSSWMCAGRSVHVVHCAAKLSFREQDREQVFATNVGGTKALWNTLAASPQIASMNHVSTAFVAGNQEGVIREQLTAKPPEFNNPYEESKWVAEHLAWQCARAQSVGMRVVRPSIIIGQSKTYRSSSDNGLYKFASILSRLRDLLPPTTAVPLLSNPDATVNFIPVDLVVGEMLDIIQQGSASLGRIFHLTNERPLTVGEIFANVAPETGVRLKCASRRPDRGDRTITRLTRLLRYYEPYLQRDRTFDRTNVRECAMANRQASYLLDLTCLSLFVRTYYRQAQSRSRGGTYAGHQ